MAQPTIRVPVAWLTDVLARLPLDIRLSAVDALNGSAEPLKAAAPDLVAPPSHYRPGRPGRRATG